MVELNRRKFLSTGVLMAGGAVVGSAVGTDGVALARSPRVDKFETCTRELDHGWSFVAAKDTGLGGQELSSAGRVPGLQPAVVPGTPLTSLIANGVYPDPLYRHIVTDTVPDSLKDTDYWYRTSFEVPRLIPGQRFWLHFDGINYTSQVWVNGSQVGATQGAFMRGVFDVTDQVVGRGRTAHLAVRVGKLDYSEGPEQPSYASHVTRGGRNGGPTGITLENGPTFFCTAGWDWLPTIPDRDLGIWQPVRWATTGPMRLADVHVDPTLSDDLRRADVTLTLTIDNAADRALPTVVTGTIGGARFRKAVSVPAGSSTVTFTPSELPQLRLHNPRLWWPNGYGEPYRYRLSVGLDTDGQLSDEHETRFGLRRIEYSVPRTDPHGAQVDTLAISVNNQPILIMGGNWGLDEALKRIPRERLFAQVRLHREANLNLIRNWNGQSSSEDFYDACDEYGILVWQDFFSSTEGPGPVDIARDVANIRECIVRFRNHPCVLLWCGGNEGPPKPELIAALNQLGAELDPKRLVLTSSAGDTGANAVNGYTSGGPYGWVTPATHYSINDGTQWPPFHNEVGSYSIPTFEFIKKMIPPASWEHPNDFWADRDVNGNGQNGGGAGYIKLTDQRYTQVRNLADFARKSQLMNYECIKAIYESRAAAMLGVESGRPYPSTGVVMWMTNPAQPSFVWQMYSHDLEAHSSFYAVKRACRRVNVVLDNVTWDVAVANHTRSPLGGTVHATLYDVTGAVVARTQLPVQHAGASDHTRVGSLADEIAAAPAGVTFVHLTFDGDRHDGVTNFYWVNKDAKSINTTTTTDPAFVELAAMKAAVLDVDARTESHHFGGGSIAVRVTNCGDVPALMVHLQVYDTRTGERVLPATFDENYLNLVPGESATARVAVAGSDHRHIGVRVDGWELDTDRSRLHGHNLTVTFNDAALQTDPAVITFDQ